MLERGVLVPVVRLKELSLGVVCLLTSCGTAASPAKRVLDDAGLGDVAPAAPRVDASHDASLDVDDVGVDAGVDTGLLAIPASVGAWNVTQDVSLSGNGTGDLGMIAVSHGVGSVLFRGESASAFVYQAVATPTGASDDAGSFVADTDYEVVAVSADRVVLTWVTCTGSRLTYVYYESTDGFSSDKEVAASGVCAVAASAVSEPVALPALDLSPPMIIPGFTIDGALLSYDGTEPGRAAVGGTSWSLYPFHEIDCSTCATPGWFELHSLFWQPASQTACLGILYLEANAPASVELAYFLCLPSVQDPIGEELTYSATWTTP